MRFDGYGMRHIGYMRFKSFFRERRTQGMRDFADRFIVDGILVLAIVVIGLVLAEAIVVEVGRDIALSRFFIASFGVPAVLVQAVPTCLFHFLEEVHPSDRSFNCLLQSVGAGRLMCFSEDIDIKVILFETAFSGLFLFLDELIGAFVAYFSRFEVGACGEEGL